jgi:hypothetical protein
MAEIFMKALQGPDAEVWAELHLLKIDVAASIDAMSLLAGKYIDHRNPTAEDVTITCSLFRDAVVRFVGCFDATDEKHRLSADTLYGPGTIQRESFDVLRSIRTAFIAHRFGAFRQAVFRVAILSNGRKFTMEHDMIHRHPDQDEAKRILEVMRVAEAHLNVRLREITGKLVAAMRALSPQEFDALPVAELYHQIRLDEIAMPRQKFLKRRRTAGGGVTLLVDETLLTLTPTGDANDPNKTTS